MQKVAGGKLRSSLLGLLLVSGAATVAPVVTFAVVTVVAIGCSALPAASRGGSAHTTPKVTCPGVG